MENIGSTLTYILRSLEEIKKEVNSLRSENRTLTEQLENNLEFYNSQSRLNNLVFYGLTENDEEDPISIITNVLDIFNEKLNIHITTNDIVKVYRIGKPIEDRVRPVLIKFSKTRMREYVLKNAKQLNGTGYSLREHFTAKALQGMRNKNKKGNCMDNNSEDTLSEIKELENSCEAVQDIKENISNEIEMCTSHDLSLPTRKLSENTIAPRKHKLSTKLTSVYNDVIKYKASGFDDIAESLCLSVETELGELSESGRDVITMLYILSDHYKNIKDYKKVRSLLNRAFAYQMAVLLEGSKDQSILDTMQSLVEINFREGVDTEILIKQLFVILVKLRGENHIDIVRFLNKCGEACIDEEQKETFFEEALKMINVVVTVEETYYDDLIAVKSNLANYYWNNDEKYKGADISKEIVNMHHEKVLGTITSENEPVWELAEKHFKVGYTFDNDLWTKLPKTVNAKIYKQLEHLSNFYRNTKFWSYAVQFMLIYLKEVTVE